MVWRAAAREFGEADDQILRRVRALPKSGLLEGDLLGRVILRDDIRPQSAQVIDELRDEGLRSVVLTGDNQAAGDICAPN